MGDFNAKVGQPKPEENFIMKKYGYGTRNERGERLVVFAKENKLSIINTFFKKPNNRRWTWRSPDGLTKNEIDYILTTLYNNVIDIQVLNINFPTDHRFLRVSMTLKKCKKSRAQYKNKSVQCLKSEEDKNRYLESLSLFSEDLELKNSNDNTQTYYDRIIHSIESSLRVKNTLKQQSSKTCIISDHTRKLIHRRQELHKIKPKTRAIKSEIKALYKLISKNINRDYMKHRTTTIENHMNTTGSLKRAYKELNSHKTWIEELQKSEKTSHSRADIVEIATNFYKDLYDTKKINISSNLDYQLEIDNREVGRIEEFEVIKQINKLKLGKCPGPDKITNEAIITAKQYLAGPLARLFNMILDNGCTPNQWAESEMILLYKKGDPKNISNYRPISLLPSIYKLFSSIIEKRISVTLEHHQPIEQAGFRKGFCTIDHIHTVELIIEKYREYQRPLYIAFIDYQKAFDTILHSSIWEALKTQDVENKYIDILKYLYRRCKSSVRLDKIGPPISINRGVRQGDPLSPRIFIAVLESVFRKLNWAKKGININGNILSHLRFADDIALFSENAKDMESMIKSLQEASSSVGLEINLSKTKLITNSLNYPININSEPLEYVDYFIYLGKQISFANRSNELEVERRITGAWRKFWGLKEVLKGSMPIKIKKKVMDSYLLPSISYASQTWKYTVRIQNKLITCQRSMERSIINVRKIQKIPHELIRNQTKITDALSFSLKLKFRWAGHIARMTDNRWTHQITAWPGPSGKRKRGRPVGRWEDDITKLIGKDWMTKAQDRDDWKGLEEAFTLI